MPPHLYGFPTKFNAYFAISEPVEPLGLAELPLEGLLELEFELELLEELGEIPMDICNKIEKESDRKILKSWLKAAARVQSFDAFREIMK